MLLSDHGPDCGRALRYTWEAHLAGRAWVGVNTMNPNRVVGEAIAAGRVPGRVGYARVRPEVRYGPRERSRIDLLLSGGGRAPCYVEVKNATMRCGDGVRFPDAVTTRGRKHLLDLAREARLGHRAQLAGGPRAQQSFERQRGDGERGESLLDPRHRVHDQVFDTGCRQ